MTKLDEKVDRAKTVLTGAAALAAAVTVTMDEEHDEVVKVSVLGVPLFKRDEETGRPRVLGIPFPRWIRGRR
jgi:hypothetical protein